MPLKPGSSSSTIGTNIKEFHTGKTYAHTKAKFGKEDADKQAAAVAMSEARGRAFGGVAPMMAQAFNPTMGVGANPAIAQQQMNPAINQPMNPTMPQTPTNGVAGGVMPTPMMLPQMGMPQQMPGPAGARPFNQGGGVASPIKMTKGPIVSAVPGRTDRHFTHVPSGSYVIPADIVSAHGEGNTLAGIHTLHNLFKMGEPNTSGHTHVPNVPKLAKGGHVSHVGRPVPVKLAGGEIVVPPENVLETMKRICKKNMTLAECHKAMDQWVVNQRKKLRKTLAKLPGPARD